MFVKYNTVLREVGKKRSDEDHYLSATEIEDAVKDTTGDTTANMYTTTLHVINSVTIKLSKLTYATKVYRGMSIDYLPAELEHQDESNVRGGVEFGFLSCSKQRHEALRYAHNKLHDKAVLLEMQMGCALATEQLPGPCAATHARPPRWLQCQRPGAFTHPIQHIVRCLSARRMIDRGADFAWLSQYPHEEEVLFAPLSGLEVLSHRLEDDVLVIDVRPSVNLNAMTIEDVIAKMRNSHVQLLEMLEGDLKFAGVPKALLTPLTQYKTDATTRPSEWWNNVKNYSRATAKALERQNDVFQLLADPSEAEFVSRKMNSRQINKTAAVCARSGKHTIAVHLLLLASRQEDVERHKAKGANDAPPGGAPAAARADEKLPVTAELVDDKLPATARITDEHHQGLARHTQSIATTAPTSKSGRLMAPPNLTSEDRERFSDHIVHLYNIAAHMVTEGLAQPWSETFASLAPSLELAEEGDAADAAIAQGRQPERCCSEHAEQQTLPKELFEKLVRHLIQFHFPFNEGAEVLVRDEGGHRWEKAVIKEVKQQDSRGTRYVPLAETKNPKSRSGNYGSPPGSGHLSFYGSSHESLPEKSSGYANRGEPTYSVQSWRELTGVPQHRVLAMDEDVGVGALLRIACRQGDVECVALLLACSINLFQACPRGNTNLILAAKSGHHKVCKLLLDSWGGDIDSKDGLHQLRNMSRQNAYDLAVGAKHAKVIRLLTPSVSDKDMKNDATDEKNGVTTLMRACRKNDIDTARHILDQDPAMLHKLSRGGCSALTVAAEEGHVELVHLLLDRNAQPNHCKDGRSALLLACQAGHLKVVQLLIDHNADVNLEKLNMVTDESGNKVNKDKRTALMFASQFGQTECVKELLAPQNQAGEDKFINTDAGQRTPNVANLNAVNCKRETALMFATRYGHHDTVKFLLDSGIDLSLETQRDGKECPSWTSLHRAAANGHIGSVRLLLRYAGKHDPKLRIDLLNHVDDKGVTALMAAAGSNFSEVVAWLLDEPDIEFAILDKRGHSALFEAARLGQLDALNQLLKFLRQNERHKHLIDEQNHDGDTPLMAACKTGHAEVVRVLLNASANVSLEKTSGEDALTIAARVGSKHVMQLLVSIAKSPVTSAQIDRAKEVAVECGKDEIVRLLSSEKTFARLTREKTATKLVEGVIIEDTAEDLRNEEQLKPETIAKKFKELTFKRLFSGMIVPPRPTEVQVDARKTPAGPLLEHNGIVSQLGPFDSIWLRAGCKSGVHWHRLWQTLQKYVEVHLQAQRALKRPKPIYVCISQRCMQAIDFTWLSEKGFVFHHYRKPGHGDAEDMDGPRASMASRANSRSRAITTTVFGANSEFVYYCYPGGTGDAEDPVPVYATSIEGATAVLLSTDETNVLLVWERGAWSTPGGAVNAGECKFEALVREVKEEVSATVDEKWGAYYLGGWQAGRARDCLVNDNFSGFVVKLEKDDFKVDEKEINQACFFPWKPLLEEWRRAGKPEPFEVVEQLPGMMAPLPEKQRKINDNLLRWLDLWDSRRALKCATKIKDHAGTKFMKLTIGV